MGEKVAHENSVVVEMRCFNPIPTTKAYVTLVVASLPAREGGDDDRRSFGVGSSMKITHPRYFRVLPVKKVISKKPTR